MSAARVIPPARIATARERHKLSDLVGRTVKLVKRGGEHVGLCPFHSEKTPSFHVIDGKGFFHCFGCGAHGDAITWTMQMSGVAFHEAVDLLAGGATLPEGEIAKIESERQREAGDRKRSLREIARRVWAESTAIAGTPGEAYFRGRGITIALPPTLRYHREVAFGPRAARIWLPAVVAAVQGPDGRIDAVHRIFLDPGSIAAASRGFASETTDGGALPGQSAYPRKIEMAQGKALLGTVKGGAVRFAAAAARMATCEGLETGAAILQALPETALWPGIDTTHMAAIVWPPIVRELVVFADRDRVSTKPGMFFGKRPGEFWAERAAAAFVSAAGRTASIVMPQRIAGMGDKADFNDVLLAG